MPDVFMIGGANGAGKTTFALKSLPQYVDAYELVNADEIARGLNPVRPSTAQISAGRIMIERMGRLIEAKKNFAFETTCSSYHDARILEKCRAEGFRLNFIFLWLPSADMAIERVKQRVKQGGHNISEATICRRFAKGLQNMMNIYLPLVDRALIVDNSSTILTEKGYSIIAEKADETLTVFNEAAWKEIRRATQ